MAESNVAKVANGQPAEVTVEAIPDRRYKSVLRQVIPTADRTKATVMVKVTILEKDKDLKPEMSAKVTFLEPEKAEVAKAKDAPVVTVVEAGGRRLETANPRSSSCARARRWPRPVVTGTDRQDQVVIQDGLAGGETVILRPPDTLEGRGRREDEGIEGPMSAVATAEDGSGDGRDRGDFTGGRHDDGRRARRPQGLQAGQPGDPGPGRPQPPGEGGRFRGPHGALRLGQDDPAEPHRGDRPAHLGPGRGGGDRRGPALGERARHVAEPERRASSSSSTT